MANDETKEENDTPDKDFGLESPNGCSKNERDLAQRIVAQVEFYLSDESILNNTVLLTCVLQNAEGYVSLKRMASFRKLKRLTENWRLVRDALRASTRLEVNAEGTMVRRREPLPDRVATPQSRTVVAYPLPDDKVFVKAVAKMFSHCGPISLIRLLQPGGTVPHIAKRFVQRHPRMSGCCAAVVKFEHQQGAIQALRQDNPSLRVLALLHNPDNATNLNNVPNESAVVTGGRRRQPVVPSSGVSSQFAHEPRNESHSHGDVSTRLWVKKRTDGSVLVLRQPRGPDGTKGFHHRDMQRTPPQLASDDTTAAAQISPAASLICV